MLFQSDYWLASIYSERLEVIQRFLETDEGIQTLLVLDQTSVRTDTKDILDVLKETNELPCTVRLVTETDTIEYSTEEEYTKTIYLRNRLDTSIIQLIRSQFPILALFV